MARVMSSTATQASKAKILEQTAPRGAGRSGEAAAQDHYHGVAHLLAEPPVCGGAGCGRLRRHPPLGRAHLGRHRRQTGGKLDHLAGTA